MAYIYEPIACHSYNEINVDNKQVKVATIDTILAFYLSFIYANMPHYDKDRLMCIAMFLFEIEQRNRLEQRGILKRFSIDCYGKQPTLEDIRSEKSEKFKEFGNDKTSKEYQMWFLKYVPGEIAKEKGLKKIQPPAAKTRKNRPNQESQPEPEEESTPEPEPEPENPLLALLRKRIT
jgi:hypothetical protein